MRNRVNVGRTTEEQEHCEDGIWGRADGQGQRDKVAEGQGKSEDRLGAGSIEGGRAEGVESMRAELAEGRGQFAEDG